MNSASIPTILKQDILSRFHKDRQPHVAVDIDSRGQVGFWNWDRSHFIPCFDSIEAGLREIALPPAPHFAEDALGLGLLHS